MPSFDVELKVDAVELKNAVDQAQKEIGTRYDFRGTAAAVEQKDLELTLIAESDFQLRQVRDVLIGKLAKRGVECGYFYGDGGSDASRDLAKAGKIGDVLVAFGGDGTMLNVVGYCAQNEIPILGVNLGRIGFLSEASKDELEKVVDALVSGGCTVERRAMLCADTGSEKLFALNEIVLGTDSNSRVCTIDVSVNGHHADSVRGDGVIVATATGSTAYSLSCNGPVLAPDVNAFIINAICPHSLHFCPIVVNSDSRIKLVCGGSGMRLTADGRIFALGDGNCAIDIARSPKDALFIRFGKQSFYEKLVTKLSYWGE